MISLSLSVLCWLGCCILRTNGFNQDDAASLEGLIARVEALEAVIKSEALLGIPDGGGARVARDPAERFVLARAQADWHGSTRFLAAVDGMPRVTAVHIMNESPGRIPHHFVVGGVNGMLHVHTITGRLLLEHETEGASAVTAIAEAKQRMNQTNLITGHANGCVLWHILEHSISWKDSQAPATVRLVQNSSYCPDAGSVDAMASIKLLTVGKMYQQQKKLAAVAVTEGNDVIMLRDNGRPPAIAKSNRNILHLALDNRQVKLLTDQGFSHTTLHSKNETVRHMRCKEMNETRLVAAVPDAEVAQKAYGFTRDGEFVAVALPGEKRVISCRMRFKRKGGMEIMRGAAMAPLHDGMLMLDSERLMMFNSSGRSSDYRLPAIQDKIASLPGRFGVHGNHSMSSIPALSANADGYVLLQLSDSIVAIYHRPTPVVSSFNAFDWMKWTRPLMLFGAVIFGVFQFSQKRNSRSLLDKDFSAAEMRMRRQLQSQRGRISEH